jgi:putative ABC transport system permease protein
MVDGEYFAAMQIPLRTGRLFGTADDGNAPPVVIVNEAAARRFFAAPEQALGKSVRLTGATGEQQVTIVGVVGDVRHTSLAMAPQPEMYRPMAQAFGMAMTLVARTTGAPASASAAVRTAVWSVDPNVAIAGMGPLTAVVRDNLARPRMMAVLLAVFAAVGLAIVLCGVYGVVAYTVRRREREMGIRLALGAGPWAVAALVLRQGLSYAVAASLLGLPLALAGARVLRGLLFGVQPHDPATLAFICVAVVSTTLAATLLPARRAGRVEPAAVLKGN